MISKFATAAVLVAAAWSTGAAAAPISVDIRVAPPAPRYEVVPAARDGYMWVPGHWDWRGRRHHWVSGTWVRERPGYVYTQPTWVNNDGRWYLYRGEWARRGDRDGDGIPNRFDRNDGRYRDRDRDGIPNRWDRVDNRKRAHDRDRDGIPNRLDRDRDGDGVRNTRDARPDNPNRR